MIRLDVVSPLNRALHSPCICNTAISYSSPVLRRLVRRVRCTRRTIRRRPRRRRRLRSRDQSIPYKLISPSPLSDASPSRRTRTTRTMGKSSTDEMVATREEMKAAKLDIGYRDFCAHLLIPLNACRRKSFYLPWKCEHERHVYEKCQYKEYV